MSGFIAYRNIFQEVYMELINKIQNGRNVQGVHASQIQQWVFVVHLIENIERLLLPAPLRSHARHQTFSLSSKELDV